MTVVQDCSGSACVYIYTFCCEHVLKLPETCSQTFGYSHLACKATWHTAQHKVACTYGTYSMCTELALLLWQLYEKMVRLRPIIDVDPKTRLRITHLLSKVRPTRVLPSTELLDLDTFKTRVPIAINCVRIVRLQQSHTDTPCYLQAWGHTPYSTPHAPPLAVVALPRLRLLPLCKQKFIF